MKWIGTALLLGAAGLIGHFMALERERRVRELAALIHALERLETEVVYGLTYLVDAFSRVGEDYPECRVLFVRAAEALRRGGTARTAWAEGVRAHRLHSSLTREDLRPLEKTGMVLGLSSAHDQQRHLQLARREVEARLEEARERLPQVTRLCRTLGVFGGVATVLLLL